MFAGKKSAQIREILISESAWEEMTCLFAPSLGYTYDELMKLSSPRGDVWFENIPDSRNPGSVLEGPHSTGATLPEGQSGRAGSRAHIILSDTLKQTTTKAESISAIKLFINKYVRNAQSILDALQC